MPIYVMVCGECGNEYDIYRTVAKMDEDLPVCCGKQTKRKIVAPNIAPDIAPFISPVDGKLVSGRSDRREHMKRHGLIEVGNEKLKGKRKEYNDHDIKSDIADVVNNL